MYLWSKLSSIKWNDAWEERLYGNPLAVIEEIKGGKSIRVQVYTDTEVEAEQIKAQFGGSVRKVNSKEWETPQDLTQKPLLIRDKIILTQTVDSEQYRKLKSQYPDRIVLNIPAEMAFGTGDHATTSMCLRFLVDECQSRREPWSCLDVGCGTGVIAIAAHHLGANHSEAFDFDEKAIEVAGKNLIINNSKNVELYTADVFEWETNKKFDFIAANLFSTILQKAFPILRAALAANGSIVISGILAEQWTETENAATKAGLTFHTAKKKGKWVSALGQKI